MIHVFLLIVLMADKTVSKDMYFYDIEQCHFFAEKVVKDFGMMAGEHRRTAYCKPIWIEEKSIEGKLY